ncbi:phosphatidylglycerophosphatase [Anaplasma phagocytophilum str. Norway variant1]|uniref:Phosphatidylglycerophosphatase n=2 Tax=Anaplasma phagocytophilum TaxID=948 RepID=A0A7H9DZA2_ANAPH|nr:phosphatidylglycerophosphatase [Anaplasma phagocytophilum str. Norway variant1]
MLKSLFKLFMRLVGAVVPVRLVSTFLGMGHLPAWQEHWTSLAVLVMVHALCYIMHGSPPMLANAAFNSGLVIAPFFLQVSAGLLVLGIVSIFIQNNDQGRGLGSGDTTVIQLAFGQVLTVALAMPAAVALYESVISLYNKVCMGIFSCPLWVNYFMHLLVFFIIPFLFFNVMIIIKPWPVSALQLRYSTCMSVMSEGLVLASYSIVIMYVVAFIFAGLQITSAAKYMKVVIYFALAGPNAFF